jgi:hypothetical protein
MKTFVVICIAAMVFFIGTIAYHMEPPATKASPAVATNQDDKVANRRAGCRKLMIVVTESLDAIMRDCPPDMIAKVANDRDAAKCVTVALVLYNRTRGKRDLEVIPTDVSHDVAVACMMMKHGDTEEIVEAILRQRS